MTGILLYPLLLIITVSACTADGAYLQPSDVSGHYGERRVPKTRKSLFDPTSKARPSLLDPQSPRYIKSQQALPLHPNIESLIKHGKPVRFKKICRHPEGCQARPMQSAATSNGISLLDVYNEPIVLDVSSEGSESIHTGHLVDPLYSDTALREPQETMTENSEETEDVAEEHPSSEKLPTLVSPTTASSRTRKPAFRKVTPLLPISRLHLPSPNLQTLHPAERGSSGPTTTEAQLTTVGRQRFFSHRTPKPTTSTTPLTTTLTPQEEFYYEDEEQEENNQDQDGVDEIVLLDVSGPFEDQKDDYESREAETEEPTTTTTSTTKPLYEPRQKPAILAKRRKIIGVEKQLEEPIPEQAHADTLSSGDADKDKQTRQHLFSHRRPLLKTTTTPLPVNEDAKSVPPLKIIQQKVAERARLSAKTPEHIPAAPVQIRRKSLLNTSSRASLTPSVGNVAEATAQAEIRIRKTSIRERPTPPHGNTPALGAARSRLSSAQARHFPSASEQNLVLKPYAPSLDEQTEEKKTNITQEHNKRTDEKPRNKLIRDKVDRKAFLAPKKTLSHLPTLAPSHHSPSPVTGQDSIRSIFGPVKNTTPSPYQWLLEESTTKRSRFIPKSSYRAAQVVSTERAKASEKEPSHKPETDPVYSRHFYNGNINRSRALQKAVKPQVMAEIIAELVLSSTELPTSEGVVTTELPTSEGVVTTELPTSEGVVTTEPVLLSTRVVTVSSADTVISTQTTVLSADIVPNNPIDSVSARREQLTSAKTAAENDSTLVTGTEESTDATVKHTTLVTESWITPTFQSITATTTEKPSSSHTMSLTSSTLRDISKEPVPKMETASQLLPEAAPLETTTVVPEEMPVVRSPVTTTEPTKPSSLLDLLTIRSGTSSTSQEDRPTTKHSWETTKSSDSEDKSTPTHTLTISPLMMKHLEQISKSSSLEEKSTTINKDNVDSILDESYLQIEAASSDIITQTAHPKGLLDGVVLSKEASPMDINNGPKMYGRPTIVESKANLRVFKPKYYFPPEEAVNFYATSTVKSLFPEHRIPKFLEDVVQTKQNPGEVMTYSSYTNVLLQ